MATRRKKFIAARDFSIDGRTYQTGGEYVPDRYFERLTRGGFVVEATNKKETDHGNG